MEQNYKQTLLQNDSSAYLKEFVLAKAFNKAYLVKVIKESLPKTLNQQTLLRAIFKQNELKEAYPAKLSQKCLLKKKKKTKQFIQNELLRTVDSKQLLKTAYSGRLLRALLRTTTVNKKVYSE